jgi:hypothetical protein
MTLKTIVSRQKNTDSRRNHLRRDFDFRRGRASRSIMSDGRILAHKEPLRQVYSCRHHISRPNLREYSVGHILLEQLFIHPLALHAYVVASCFNAEFIDIVEILRKRH